MVEPCAALTTAHGKVFTVFNPSPLPSQSDIRDRIPWNAVDWLIVNEDEGRALSEADERCKKSTAQIVFESELETDAKRSVIEALVQSSFANVGVVLTLGARGCQVAFRASQDDSNWVVFTSPASQGSRPVIDTTGAGDCFTVSCLGIPSPCCESHFDFNSADPWLAYCVGIFSGSVDGYRRWIW